MILDYALSDLLMFTLEVYQRLFIRLNTDAWPWQAVVVLAGLAVIPLLLQPGAPYRRGALVLMALAWAGSGAGFLMTYFAPINWPAQPAGVAFLIQAGLILLLACSRFVPAGLSLQGREGRSFVNLWLFVLLLMPWMSALDAGAWRAVALFGMTPDITALGWVVFSLRVARPVRWLLLIIPLLWCLFSLLTLWELGASLMLLVPLSGLLAGLLALFAGTSPGPGARGE